MENGEYNFLTEKENIGFLPTPIHPLKNISNRFGYNIWVKRDDQTGLAFGGNKTRILEYLMRQVLVNKNDCVITVGWAQSNYVRQTAAACRLYNLDCHLILIGNTKEYKDDGNILLSKMLGAKISYCNYDSEVEARLEELVANLTRQGKKPAVLPSGGFNSTGVCGYINAFKEILEDEKRLGFKFDYIVLASCALGTQCGLILGNKLFKANRKIYGIPVCTSLSDSKSGLTNVERMKNMFKEFAQKHGFDFEIDDEDIIYDTRFHSGFSVICDDDRKALDIFAKEEAIFLDPVYSSRAAGAMFKILEDNEIPKDANILFLHTGGGPILFSETFKYEEK